MGLSCRTLLTTRSCTPPFFASAFFLFSPFSSSSFYIADVNLYVLDAYINIYRNRYKYVRIYIYILYIYGFHVIYPASLLALRSFNRSRYSSVHACTTPHSRTHVQARAASNAGRQAHNVAKVWNATLEKAWRRRHRLLLRRV